MITIGGHSIGRGHRPFIIAEMSGNHNQSLDRAIEMYLQAAAELDGGDPLREADIWLELRILYGIADRYADYADALARARALIPDDRSSPARARALLASAATESHHGDPAAELAFAREAVTVAEDVGDPAIVVRAHIDGDGRTSVQVRHSPCPVDGLATDIRGPYAEADPPD